MTEELRNRRVAFVVANEGIEEVELLQPWRAVIDAGGTAVLVAPEAGLVETMRHLDRRPLPCRPGHRPGARRRLRRRGPAGWGGDPDALRTDAAAVDFLMAMFEAGKPVAAICHGPWTLIEGDLVAGRTLTSWPSLQTDLRNAGAYWVDREVVVCHLGINTLVTSRKPEDLAAFSARWWRPSLRPGCSFEHVCPLIRQCQLLDGPIRHTGADDRDGLIVATARRVVAPA